MATYFYSRSKQASHLWDQSTDSQRSVFVGNISYQTNEDELRSFFNDSCGCVSAVRITYGNKTGENRGFGFVKFDTSAAYEKALTLNGRSLNGKKLKIVPHKPQITSNSTTTNSTIGTESVDSALTAERKTHVVHCKKSKYDVYIGRPSIWGNPFLIAKDGDKAERLQKYRAWIMNQPELLARAKIELRGRTLACWCKPEACHGDILAEIADTD